MTTAPATAPYALQAKRLRYAVPAALGRAARPLLHDVTFAVAPGEIVGLLGHNGAGKTTVMRLLLGLLRADAGEALLFGGPSHHAASRVGLGFLPERTYYPMALSAQEMVTAHAQLCGLPRRAAKIAAAEVLARVQLTEHAGRPLKGFSKGMLQRAGLAQALVGKPRLLLLDEPCSGLDPAGRAQVRALVADERRRGCAVLLCTHVLADVQALCDRVVVLRRGRVHLTGTPAELVGAQGGAQGFTLRCEAVPPAALAEAKALATSAEPDAPAPAAGWCFHLADAAHANALVDHLRRHNVALHALQPVQHTLEDVVVQEVAAP